jgi:hypothetical protein
VDLVLVQRNSLPALRHRYAYPATLEKSVFPVLTSTGPSNSAAMKLAVTNYASSLWAEPHPHDCVTTQMTLDARDTGMTLALACATRLARLTIRIS